MENFKIISFNTEGISPSKVELISKLQPDILCLQETHKNERPPNIPGMHLIVYHKSPIYGSAIYAKEKSHIMSSDKIDKVSEDDMEVLLVETIKVTIIAVYKPPATPFKWPQTLTQNKPTVIIGDFNSHSTLWGYKENNHDGDSL